MDNKTETVEQAAEKRYPLTPYDYTKDGNTMQRSVFDVLMQEAFKEGAEWQKNLSGSCEGWMNNEQWKEMSELFDVILNDSFEYISTEDYHKGKKFIQLLNSKINPSTVKPIN